MPVRLEPEAPGLVSPQLKQNDQNSENSTVKHVLSGHSKTDKAMVLKTNGSLMKVEILQYF